MHRYPVSPAGVLLLVFFDLLKVSKITTKFFDLLKVSKITLKFFYLFQVSKITTKFFDWFKVSKIKTQCHVLTLNLTLKLNLILVQHL